MELLTFIGQAAKRRDAYVERAQSLADSFQTLEALEEEMDSRAKALAKRLYLEKVSFTEFQRAMAEDTLVSSLAALILGSKGRPVTQNLFSEAMGQMQYLWPFFDELQASLKSGKLTRDQEFAEGDEEDEEGEDWDRSKAMIGSPVRSDSRITRDDRTNLLVPAGPNAVASAMLVARTSRSQAQPSSTQISSSQLNDPESAANAAQNATRSTGRAQGPASWGGVLDRIRRFLVTPLYRWFQTGRFDLNESQGAREMRRVSRRDRRVCRDCRHYASLGWVPIGAVPMPGINCQCFDRCRCAIEYR